MPAWRDLKLEELSKQLCYSPPEKRADQLAAALDLVPRIDPTLRYPWEFVLFRLTGYRPKTPVEHEIPGIVLRADLSQLVEVLSETLSLPVAGAAEPVLTLEQVTTQFNVSTKTIQRWRRQGLIAMRYVFGDGRRRLGFLGSAIKQFSAANAERINRSSSFKQLSDDEKRSIIAVARALVGRDNPGIKEIALRVAHQLGRSPETVRYTIRKHDQEFPEAAVFPEATEAIGDADRQRIMDYLSAGMPLSDIAEKLGRTAGDIDRLVHEDRLERILGLQMGWVHNPLFDLPDADEVILGLLAKKSLAQATKSVAAGSNAKADDLLMARMPKGLPAFLAQVFQTPVMPQELETDAFRRMNYLKYKAARLRDACVTMAGAKLGEARRSEAADAIGRLLAQAAEIKNQLLQTNLRVAVHVARKHQRYGTDLMELVSDASVWLMRAIDKFDFARGVKFSTYASYAIMKNFARGRVEQIARRDRKLVTGQEEILNQIGERDGESVADTIDRAAEMGDLVEVLERLPARDRELISAHYGLGEANAMSLAELGAKLGVTKTRVQQLEAAAIKKLRRLMQERRQRV